MIASLQPISSGLDKLHSTEQLSSAAIDFIKEKNDKFEFPINFENLRLAADPDGMIGIDPTSSRYQAAR
jgi:hypothetical protein